MANLNCIFENVRIENLSNERKLVKVYSNNEKSVLTQIFETKYPLELINMLLKIGGPKYLFDEIQRDEDPHYVQYRLERAILSYVPEKEFENAKLLDFGCGAGASTMILARLFPTTKIVGVDISKKLLKIGEMRSEYYACSDRVNFIISPRNNQLPRGIGPFDFIVLNAVYEHLLPTERKCIIEQLWNLLKPGGIIFINETPYRYYPLEIHTTGLPLINYLPDRMAFALARRFSKKNYLNHTWKMLLRRGIRGATEREIIELIIEQNGNPSLLSPKLLGMRNQIDLWYVPSQYTNRLSGTLVSFNLAYSMSGSRLFRSLLKLVLRSTGIAFLHSITMAIRKL